MKLYSKMLLFGIFAGPVCLFLVLFSFILVFITQPSFLMDFVFFFLTIGTFCAYLIFLNALRVVAEKKNNTDLVKTIKRYIVFVVIVSIPGCLTSFITVVPAISLIAFIIVLLLSIPLGIILLQFAKQLQKLESEFGEIAKRASFWNRISGWLIISVIFSIFSGITSLIADYYLWLILRKYLKFQNSTI